MNRITENEWIAAIDIGTAAVTAVIAERLENDELQIIGLGSCPFAGIKKGVIVNIDATVAAISKAMEEAEQMAEIRVQSVSVSISGSHIHSFNSNGIVAIRNNEVSNHDLERVIDAAKAVAIPSDQRVLHILPQEFLVDGQAGIKEPIGMSGVRLEAKVHMVSGSVSAAQNIVKCVHYCDLDIDDLVLGQLASSYACLGEDEKQLGVCLVDIGGGTTDIAVFTEGAIRHTAVLPIAGHQVTNDIAHALRSSVGYAENVKIQYGYAMTKLTKQEDSIDVQGISERTSRRLSLQTLAGVIESRYEELFTLIQRDLQKNGFLDMLAGGIVLTGGSSKIKGCVELAEEVFRMTARVGIPQGFTGMEEVLQNPVYTCAVGLLYYARQQRKESDRSSTKSPTRFKVVDQVKQWFSKNT